MELLDPIWAEPANAPNTSAIPNQGLQVKVRAIGNDIFCSEQPTDFRYLKIDGKKYSRLMNRLFIPGKTTDLTAEQISVVNQFRDFYYHHDTQFSYNTDVKNIFRSYIEAKKPINILEIGPGRFPILAPRSGYILVDIDENVVSFLRDQKFEAYNWEAMCNYEGKKFDIIVACFVFHFSFAEQQLALIKQLLSSEGVLIFNVLSRDPAIRTLAQDKFSLLNLSFRSAGLEDRFGKSDTVFLSSQASANIDFSIFLRELGAE